MPVGQVAKDLATLWGPSALVQFDNRSDHPHEAGLLRLDSTKAHEQLHWKPHLSLPQSLSMIVDWHRALLDENNVAAVTLAQISGYDRDETV